MTTGATRISVPRHIADAVVEMQARAVETAAALLPQGWRLADPATVAAIEEVMAYVEQVHTLYKVFMWDREAEYRAREWLAAAGSGESDGNG